MDKDLFIIIGITAVVLAGISAGIYFTGGFKNQIANPPNVSGIILFYGEGCPHCKNVEDFISQNGIADKVKFTMLEIPYNGKTSLQLQANQQLLVEKAQACSLDISQGISIPFLWDGKNCLAGDQPIIDFFKTEAGIK